MHPAIRPKVPVGSFSCYTRHTCCCLRVPRKTGVAGNSERKPWQLRGRCRSESCVHSSASYPRGMRGLHTCQNKKEQAAHGFSSFSWPSRGFGRLPFDKLTSKLKETTEHFSYLETGIHSNYENNKYLYVFRVTV